ncbi:multiple sugar transport system permease protein [Geodermatophilus obscurus]|uniref:Multiple sugar transport system permease protein n=1 Tax=Geodermatophilus obscurus TaxID=1861 RepID=A0A1I5HMA6_9ACTN|nr:hypothetical protein [Geodermatophilus obscurus]SFO49448.1 multiple sugar transport system permease protein [Geodermatophilus obscurus]
MSTVAPVESGPQREDTSRSRLTRGGATRESPLSVAAAMILLVGAAVYFLLPVYWLIVNATKTQPDLIDSNGFWFAEWNLGENLSELFARDGGIYLRWALNSLLYAGLGAAVGTLLAAMAGYAMAKYQFRGREALFALVLGGVLVPATALALPLFLLFARVDLTNTFWRCSCRASSARSASTCPGSSPRRRCPTSSSTPPGSTGPASGGSSPRWPSG